MVTLNTSPSNFDQVFLIVALGIFLLGTAVASSLYERSQRQMTIKSNRHLGYDLKNLGNKRNFDLFHDVRDDRERALADHWLALAHSRLGKDQVEKQLNIALYAKYGRSIHDIQ